MCNVVNMSSLKKRVTIVTNSDKQMESEWFEDDNFKEDNKINTTEQELVHYHRLLSDNSLSEDDIKTWFISRYRKNDEDTIYLTKHSLSRLKERCGWNKQAAMRMMKKVYDNGLRSDQIKGYLLPWIKQKETSLRPGEKFILYGDHLFIFRYEVLMTVINVPSKKSAALCRLG